MSPCPAFRSSFPVTPLRGQPGLQAAERLGECWPDSALDRQLLHLGSQAPWTHGSHGDVINTQSRDQLTALFTSLCDLAVGLGSRAGAGRQITGSQRSEVVAGKGRVEGGSMREVEVGMIWVSRACLTWNPGFSIS